jgi:hypothetical protein
MSTSGLNGKISVAIHSYVMFYGTIKNKISFRMISAEAKEYSLRIVESNTNPNLTMRLE